ncbi:succinate dehydrogenase, hydrophobic membrane anchor protein [Alisedimentitalea sp. MJ-SS2]|uniref:succinate dehydrogenase, hydrophobic membrane anchor protein n=1 Tax=Aliisedimentitalea sp. MJ-SS2 TaxID=3049795 RepID=UPI002909BF82|nr:succinate dehydrogenase, hydrophobic membrane anchor protein [Alisedimentitalea sp. MJ-SS2]MDU8926160.1 succinate dehydrogenase, hydrophobic membrane anchor protein [Alisedimentitalea sp. MJ-SS2]
MRYLTARKRAEGKGASHTGTEHHWYMTVSAVGLAFLIPAFIIVVGRAIGQGHEAVLATFARPFPAILTGLTILVGMQHFQKGATMMIEDYAQGSTRKALIMLVIVLSWTITATGLFALAKIAL